MTRILVTGGGGSAAANFCDALRLANTDYTVVATDVAPFHLELLDVAARKYLVPPVSDPGYLDALNKIVHHEAIDFVHPQPDVEVAFLSQHEAGLAAPTFLPDAGSVALCQDKMHFNTHLAELGVPVPRALALTGHDDLVTATESLSGTQAKVWLRAIRGAGSRASLPIMSPFQGEGWIDYWRTSRGLDYPDFMVSEFLPGREYAWQSLWHRGRLVISQARERTEYVFGNLTPSGQSSSPSVARTVNRVEVNLAGEAAVRAVQAEPHGVFCVDMKEGEDGQPRVTEINAGRFFTTSNFFAYAGLNMPDMYVRLGLGLAVDADMPQYDPLPEDLYWVRMIDMGFRLVRGGDWTSIPP